MTYSTKNISLFFAKYVFLYRNSNNQFLFNTYVQKTKLTYALERVILHRYCDLTILTGITPNNENRLVFVEQFNTHYIKTDSKNNLFALAKKNILQLATYTKKIFKINEFFYKTTLHRTALPKK